MLTWAFCNHTRWNRITAVYVAVRTAHRRKPWHHHHHQKGVDGRLRREQRGVELLRARKIYKLNLRRIYTMCVWYIFIWCLPRVCVNLENTLYRYIYLPTYKTFRKYCFEFDENPSTFFHASLHLENTFEVPQVFDVCECIQAVWHRSVPISI